MRSRMIGVALAAMILAAGPAGAEPPDEAFSQAHVAYMEAKVAELLAPYASTGGPSDDQYHQAWCRAAHSWKLANPGGEARLTFKVLLNFRRLQWRCGQKLNRAPPLPGEHLVKPPPTTPPPPPPGVIDSEGGNEAIEDFMRWHPEEFTDAPTETHYIERRVFWWEWMGGGPEGEAAQIARARAEWAALHPDAPRDFDGTLGDPVKPGEGAGRFYRDAEPDPSWPDFDDLTPEEQRQQAEREGRRADGSVDPLDQTAWAEAGQPIVVGPNDQVGSGAQLRQQVLGAAAGALGLGGGDRGGPTLARCRIDIGRMQSFNDPQSGVTLRVSAQRSGGVLTVYALVDQSPDKGTFQAAFLQTQDGQRQPPRDVGICRLYGQWSLSVSWTRSSYRDGALVNRESGGWTRQGEIPGLDSQADGAPDGLWRRLGFSNASRGAQMESFTFQVLPGQLAQGQTALVIHITRPGQSPVTTAPFVLRVLEGPLGVTFERTGP